MRARTPFTVEVAGGRLGGWLRGEGVPVLLLHGGPGLSFEYLDELANELGHGFQVAAYQQRGLAPSTAEGPFTIAQAINDTLAVLEFLKWSRAVIVGHSWGGHLALRLAAAVPRRLLGVLAVDPLGIVGDGGMAAFEAEMLARTPRQRRERAHELDERAMTGKGTPEEGLESLRIVWPAYFADPGNAPPMPAVRMSVPAYSGIIAEVTTGLEQVAAALGSGEVPYAVIAGAGSPMPWGQAARASAELSPRAFLTIVPAAGHFPWLEVPGSVRDALQRLTAQVRISVKTSLPRPSNSRLGTAERHYRKWTTSGYREGVQLHAPERFETQPSGVTVLPVRVAPCQSSFAIHRPR